MAPHFFRQLVRHGHRNSSLSKNPNIDTEQYKKPHTDTERNSRPCSDTEYKYTSLPSRDCIRLIHLHPAKDQDAELQCSITSYPRDSAPDYEALSYVWGEQVFNETIKTADGVLKITTSLAQALRHFRLDSQDRCLWVDAVSINQRDDEEKGYQVAHMDRIFKTASKVLAWLGEGSGVVHQAMKDCERLFRFAQQYCVEEKDIDFEVFNGPTLKTINREGKMVDATSWDLHDDHRLARIIHDQNYVSMEKVLEQIKSSNLEHLVALPWFGRLWVIQEVACSSTTSLHIANYSIEWKIFASVMRLLVGIVNIRGPSCLEGLEDKDELLTPNLRRAWNIVHLRTEWRATTIGNLFCISVYRQFGGSLNRAASHGCANDRDRVYGLLGLASPIAKNTFGLAIVPDYSKPVPHVYRDFALQFIKKSHAFNYPRDLRILQDAGLWKRSVAKSHEILSLDLNDKEYLPTWVPEYRPDNLSFDELPWTDAPFNTRFRGARPAILDISKIDKLDHLPFTKSENVLGTMATIVDRVESMIVTLNDKNDLEKFRRGEISPIGLPSISGAAWKGALSCLEAGMLFMKTLMKDEKYVTGENIRAALIRTVLAECSHPALTNILFEFPDIQDEAVCIALWDNVEKTLLNPDGEVRKFHEELEALSESEKDERMAKLRETPPDGGPRFSDAFKTCFDFSMAVKWVLGRCKLIFSTTGLLALVPKAANQYDEIIQIAGTTMPYVVRPKKGTNGLCYLVGPCYVHGLMHCPSLEADEEISRRGGLICLA